MLADIMASVKPTSVVTLSYILAQKGGFVDFIERKGILYGVLIANLESDIVEYNIHHLNPTELREFYNALPNFTKVMCNFSIEDDIISHERQVSTLDMDAESIGLFSGQVLSFKESANTFWHFLHYCLLHNVKLLLGDSFKEVSVGSLRFSDSTPNVLASLQDDTGRFASKVVYSLDKSIATVDIHVDLESVPQTLLPYLVPVGGTRYKVLASVMDTIGIEIEDFKQMFSIQYMIGVLDFREYYRCMRDAAEVIKYYAKLLNPAEVSETPKSEYTATAYAANCIIDYSVNKPRISALKKPKDTETREEFQAAVKKLMGNLEYLPEYLNSRTGTTTLDFAFKPALNVFLRSYISQGIDGVIAYDRGVAQRQALYSLEAFKWKAAMVYFNEVPSCFGNAFTTKFGVLRLRLGDVT